jgi:hypothetical protein
MTDRGKIGLRRTPANKPRKSDRRVPTSGHPTENPTPSPRNPAKSDLRTYLLNGPKVDEFEIEAYGDTGCEIEL